MQRVWFDRLLQNLPALVLKIMSGTFAPISDRYSPELRQLILNMLNLDPSKRPQLNEIMALPICIGPLLNLYTDIGSVKMRRWHSSGLVAFMFRRVWVSVIISSWLSAGLRSLCPLCRVVPREGQGGEFPQTEQEVSPIFSRMDWVANFPFFVLKAVFHILDSIRPIGGFRFGEVALPPTVLSLHVGKWNHGTAPPAHAQHRGAAGVSGPDTEDGSD